MQILVSGGLKPSVAQKTARSGWQNAPNARSHGQASLEIRDESPIAIGMATYAGRNE